ncbi:MAG TPA: helix-turn-helix domain-containing protein [Thermoanaerobaculia bacterium]|nr:helix-turn-helix domain-containing protein [Thermoanaerobaculia bacterium]
MSLQAMLWALDHQGVAPGQKLILVVLADHCGRDGECWPHVNKIAARSGISRRAVVAHLQGAREAAHIGDDRRFTDQVIALRDALRRAPIPRTSPTPHRPNGTAANSEE